MARRRHGNPGAPGGDPEDRGPAPADLLQMWISGNIGPSLESLDADAERVEESEPDDQVEESEPHDQAEDAEPDDAEAPDDAKDQPPTEEPDADAEPRAEAEVADAGHGDEEAPAPELSAEQQDAEADAEAVVDDVVPSDATELTEPAAEPEPAEPEAADVAPDADLPTAEQSWWPSDDQDETPAEPAADPSRWWPYAETEALDPTAADEPVESAEPTEPEPTPVDGETAEPATGQAAPVERVDPAADEALWHDDMEAEWVDADGDAQMAQGEPADEPEVAVAEADVAEAGDAAPDDDEGTESPSDAAPDETPRTDLAEPEPQPDDLPGPLTDREVLADRARGWASFGAAPTAEDVLDQIDIQGSWSDRFLGGPPIATPRVSSGATSQAPPAKQGAAPESEPKSSPQDDDAAESAPSDDTVVEAAAVDVTGAEPGPASPPTVQPRGLDMSSTAHWTLDDFEEYIRSQSGNELSEWIGGEPHEEPEDAVAEDGPAQVEAPADEATVPGTPEAEVAATESPAETDDAATEDTTDEPPSGAVELATTELPAVAETPPESDSVTSVESDVDEPGEQDPTDAAASQPPEQLIAASDTTVAAEPQADTGAAAPAPKDQLSRVRGLLARMGLTREPEVQEDATAHATGTHGIVVEEPVVDDQLPSGEQDVSPEPAEVSDQGPSARSWDPDATEHYDWTSAEFDGPPPWATDEPADQEPVPAPAVTQPEAVVQAPDEPEPVETDEPPSEQLSDAGSLDDEDEDHQEWYDDAGLRWTSDDGGYTWFSTDGQGWNAEIGEPIEIPVVSPSASSVVPPAAVDAPLDIAPEVTHDAEAPADPTPEGSDEAPWPDAPTDDTDTTDPSDDGWPVAEPETESAPESADDDTAAYWPEVDARPDADQQPDAGTAAEPAASTTSETADSPEADHAKPPQFVEYKPRGAYRPLLGVLFVAAAVFAVVAIFWAVSKGSQAATGIAVGVTGFALAFWWGLLSWTPTVVSVHGAILEVARGSDGERFDLRSPHLKIDVDDDTASRNWRTTITRPNGTELVIPASAVDTDEFTEIVNHYRAEATKSPGAATDS